MISKNLAVREMALKEKPMIKPKLKPKIIPHGKGFMPSTFACL